MLFHSCYRVCLKILFCFQQKAAYEMRISDWSSDVCSSDLPVDPVGRETDRMDPRQFLDEFADPLAHCPMPPVSPCGSQRQVRRRMRAADAIALISASASASSAWLASRTAFITSSQVRRPVMNWRLNESVTTAADWEAARLDSI